MIRKEINMKIHNVKVNQFDFEEIRNGNKRFIIAQLGDFSEDDFIMFNNSNSLFKIVHICVDDGKILASNYCVIGFKRMEIVE